MGIPANIRAWWSNLRFAPAAKFASIRFNDTTVTQIGSTAQTQLDWQQITDVFAYKKDCYSVDQIRILLRDEPQQRSIEVTENDEGYDALIAELPHRLPGCLPLEKWWVTVAFPAFETNWTQLYHRT